MIEPDEFKQNETFCGVPEHWQKNACIGLNGGPADFSRLARGYFAGALGMSALAAEGKLTIDIVVYPICLSYRQCLELWLKAISTELTSLYGSSLKTGGHNLSRLLENLFLERARLEPDAVSEEDLGFITSLIADWEEIDKYGTAFRYPGDAKNPIYLENWRVINLTRLHERMHRANDILDRCYWALVDRQTLSE